jgi:hypothetical protein
MRQQQAPVNAAQLKQQIRETVKQAQQAAEQAATAAADARAQGHTAREVITIPPIGPVVVGTPGSAIPIRNEIPRAVAPIAISFFVITGFVIVFSPFMRAIARRIERSSVRQSQQMPPDIRQQLDQLSASVEAIAIEVERISEGQRFTTRILTEKQPSLSEQGSQRSTP